MPAAAPADRAPGNRAAVLTKPRTIRIEEFPVPTPGEREVLVEVRSVGVCGSDVHYYEDGRIGGFVVRARSLSQGRARSAGSPPWLPAPPGRCRPSAISTRAGSPARRSSAWGWPLTCGG